MPQRTTQQPDAAALAERLACVEAKLDRLLAAVEALSEGAEADGLLDVRAACSRLGVGRTKLHELIQERHLRPVRIGRSVKIPYAQIRHLVRNGT